MYILSRPDEIQLRKLKDSTKQSLDCWLSIGVTREKREGIRVWRGTKELQGFCHLGIKEELSVAVVILIN